MATLANEDLLVNSIVVRLYDTSFPGWGGTSLHLGLDGMT